MKAFDYLAAFYGHEHEPDKFVAAVDSLLHVEDATRAAKWAYFSTPLDNSLPLFPKLLPFEQTRQFTVRIGEQAATAKPAPATMQPASDNKLDFL